METLDTICSRKSIRKYTGEGISEEELNKLLVAAEASPIASGQFQNYQLTVVENKELIAEIDANGAAFSGNPKAHPLYGAPLLIVVSAKVSAGRENPVYSSAAMIVHNIALEAVDLGIGHCDIWGTTMGLAQNPDLVKKLNLPEGYTPCCSIILGRTGETYTKREIPLDKIKVNRI